MNFFHHDFPEEQADYVLILNVMHVVCRRNFHIFPRSCA